MGTLRVCLSTLTFTLFKKAFKMSLSGTFTNVATKEAVDFYISIGYPAEQANKMIGIKTTFKNVEFAEGKLACHFMFEGHPELNSAFLVYEGVPNKLNLPHMGGPCVCTFKKTPKGIHNVIVSETMGRWEMDEEYTDEGIKMNITKDGKCFTECYKREICVDGLYKVSKLHGMKDYMKKSGYPESIIAGMEEYKMPFEGMPETKVVVSHTGLGKYSWVIKAADGSAEEWKLAFCGEGAKICGRNLKNGDTASAELY